MKGKPNPFRGKDGKAMQFIFSSRKCSLYDSTKAYAEKKLRKMEKFFTGDCVVSVLFTLEKDEKFKVEVTADYRDIIFRAQETGSDFKEAIDLVTDVLIRQIRKHKTKLEKRLRDSDFSFEGSEEPIPEENGKIIRTKSVLLKPMTPEEAALQMELSAHDFFVFLDGADNTVKVVYLRKDGDYGLIEPSLK